MPAQLKAVPLFVSPGNPTERSVQSAVFLGYSCLYIFKKAPRRWKVELKEAENIVRAYLNNQHPLAHKIAEPASAKELVAIPQPDELFEFQGGKVAIEYESDMPLVSMEKYMWLLTNQADFLPEGKKLAVVVICLDAASQPVEQVERMQKIAEKLEATYPGKFFNYHISYQQANADSVAAAVQKAYEAVKA
jgi:hypothetical protein